jgi:hypothetical protein
MAEAEKWRNLKTGKLFWVSHFSVAPGGYLAGIANLLRVSSFHVVRRKKKKLFEQRELTPEM